MADAPKLKGNEYLDESYYKINMGIDNANEALNRSLTAESNSKGAMNVANDAVNVANNAVLESYSVQEQLNQIVIEGDSSIEAAQARVDENGVVYPTLKERIDTDVNRIKYKKRNLVKNADFEVLPYIQSRSSVYSFLAGVTNPSYGNNKSMKVTATGYETSSDSTKDFAIMLTESMTSNEILTISFLCYPSVSNKIISVRMAFTQHVNVNLGADNQWNKISIDLPLSSMSERNNYLYFNLQSSFNFYMSDLRVEKKENHVQDMPVSLLQINSILAENSTKIHNSRGAIERLISIGQTYWNNVNSFVYGNLYTAYDKDLTLVNGKNQIDCSSFANLMIQGITYDKSRYNSANVQNINSPLFFQNIDGYKWRYANQIAKYALEKGYAFKPKADFSDLEPGDVVFFSWSSRDTNGDIPEDLRENSFMKIDHVAVFLHKKNESRWATIQFDNNISTVYYDATNEYMNQCVIAARFPFANLESMYESGNLLLNGDIPKNINTGSTISSYKSTKNFVKGQYYTFLVDGSILTDGGYFILQVNGKTVYSDSGKIGSYKGITALRFPYLLDDISDTITLSVGAPSGTTVDRIANVNWCSIYEGYVRNVKEYQKTIYSPSKDFALKSDLVTDLINDLAPYYKYIIDKNKMFINFSLPFSTLRTGSLNLGSLGSDVPAKTQRLPINLIGANNEAINGILQVSWDGNVSIIPYSGTTQWKSALASGCVFMI
ncbi:phage baseplate upper protein [Bacillus sp. YAF12_1]|uniref:phage baseplate upper protein n=1 Tax=Bacillus sp. YAF12_1 TaxID=3237484 RepID=UPI003F92FA40